MDKQYDTAPPERLDLAMLEQACREETRRYRRSERSDPRYCLEIFHRALRPPPPLDEPARNVLVTLYTDVIVAHINRKAVARSAVDDLVQQVWLRIWQAASKGLSFVSLEAGIAYFGKATLTAVIDEKRRAWEEQRTASFSEMSAGLPDGVDPLDRLSTPDQADVLYNEVERAFIRARCYELLTDPLARRVFWMREAMGMPPRAIAQRLVSEDLLIGGKTPTARLVSDMLERAFQRLAADATIRDLLQSD